MKTTKNAKTANATTQEKVAGKYRPNTSIAKLFLALRDGKARTEAQLQVIAGKKADVKNRLYHLGAYGKETKQWEVKSDNGKFKLIIMKKRGMVKAKKVAKVAKPAPKAEAKPVTNVA